MKLLFTYIALLLSVFVFGQQTTWQKVYSTNSYDEGRSVIQTYDTSFVVAGASSGFDGNSDMLLMKVDSLGNFKWAKTFGGAQIEWAEEVIETKDSGYVMLGYSNSFGTGDYDIYLVKTDVNGNLLWTKTYGGADWDFGFDIALLHDGGFILLGETFSYGSGNNDIYAVRTNSVGDTIWTKTFGGSGFEKPSDVIFTSDSNIVIIGESTSSGAGLEDIYIIKIDTLGNEIWNNVSGSVGSDKGASIVEDNAGDFYFIYNTNFGTVGDWDMHPGKISKNGTLSSPFGTYFGGAMEEYCNELIYDSGNDVYYFTGYTYSVGAGLSDMQIYKASNGGWWMDGNTFGDNAEEEGQSIKLCYDGGIISTGYTNLGAGVRSVFLVKMDQNIVSSGGFPEDIITGVAENSDRLGVGIYPNPASNDVIVDWKAEEYNANLTIWSASGVFIQSISVQKNQMVSVANLPQGVYFLNFQFKNKAPIVKKMIINR